MRSVRLGLAPLPEGGASQQQQTWGDGMAILQADSMARGRLLEGVARYRYDMS
jgi:hypothetical protein